MPSDRPGRENLQQLPVQCGFCTSRQPAPRFGSALVGRSPDVVPLTVLEPRLH
jgi:hypothetical protein